ncbi:hypothetical protein T4B_9528 [Trichinella pseudospiralis]|uniref:Uncharacterized protein n=2 Tax=Trichinella pseudospiralis TaxID=6337 RepID=A0A0V1FQE9_TRIPS|nr:hypothetical protein T4A_5949 [Trichinella pseudospiralis]KRY88208.1 hypothetical protein T4D_15071 [Trichinella pseudospiralis]KRZ28896.1 hypothetical protein T4B_9528 [Trichinella pseudospiralis]
MNTYLGICSSSSSSGGGSGGAFETELTELGGGHAFQWLQTVHNYARYESHYNYNAGHFFFLHHGWVNGQSMLHKQISMTAFLLALYHLGNDARLR